MSHVIAVCNQKGGVGKTTTTINLASYLAKGKKRVLAIDLDPQGNTTSGLGVDKSALESELYHVLVETADPQSVVLKTPFHGVEVLPATPVLAAAEVELVPVIGREYKLREAVKKLEGYDYILVDCPPSLGLLTVNGLAAANSVMIPVQAEYYALEGLTQLMNTVNRVKEYLNPKLDVMGVLLTMHNGRTTLSNQVHAEVKKYFPDKIFDTIIPRNVRLAEAPSYGQPISHYDKWSKGARGYKSLAQEVTRRVGAYA